MSRTPAMFQTRRVGCYLASFSGQCFGTDNKELKLVIHIEPISLDLANEVSPRIGDRLFRPVNEKEWEPARELTKATFADIHIPMQNIDFYGLPDPTSGEEGVEVQGASVSNLRASRVPGGQFRLEFDVVIPMDASTMRLVHRYFKGMCFLDMEAVQMEMAEEHPDDDIVEVQMSLQEAADGEPDGKSAGAGEGKSRRRKKAETVDA